MRSLGKQIGQCEDAQAQGNTLAGAKAKDLVDRVRDAAGSATGQGKLERPVQSLEAKQPGVPVRCRPGSVPAGFEIPRPDRRKLLWPKRDVVDHGPIAAAADADRGWRELHDAKMDCRHRLRQPAILANEDNSQCPTLPTSAPGAPPP